MMTTVTKAKTKAMTAEAKDTYDTKIAWLISLENMVLSIRRLRKDFPTLCPHITAKQSKYATELTFTVNAAIDALRWRLTDTWGISQNEVTRWMDLGPDEYKKRMDLSTYSVSHSSNLAEKRNGQIKKSRKR
jgi:hypothetical protein